jgi:hypothetical protein
MFAPKVMRKSEYAISEFEGAVRMGKVSISQKMRVRNYAKVSA